MGSHKGIDEDEPRFHRMTPQWLYEPRNAAGPEARGGTGNTVSVTVGKKWWLPGAAVSRRGYTQISGCSVVGASGHSRSPKYPLGVTEGCGKARDASLPSLASENQSEAGMQGRGG